MSLRLLTIVWERAPYKDGALLLLLALADWADDDGFAFPSVSGLAHKARMGERHARRLLREFESDGTISTEQRGVHHRPNSYRISVDKLKALPDRLKCPPSDLELTSESVQTGHGSPSEGVRMAPDPSGTVKEPSTDEKRDNELTIESGRFVDWFLSLLARTGAPQPKMTPSIRANWADAYEKLRRIDGKSKEEIKSICEWGRSDNFWKDNFFAPPKLRDRKEGISRYDLFATKILNGNTTHQRPNGRLFEAAGSYAGITDK